VVTECEVDLWNMTSTETGAKRRLEPVGFEALDARDQTWDAAFERGFCTGGWRGKVGARRP
jgi:hypothetical protein